MTEQHTLDDDALWTPVELAKFMRLSPATIQAKASRAPNELPPRVPHMRNLRWVPEICRQWAMPTRKVGRKRLEA
jgi:hypothetical protein